MPKGLWEGRQLVAVEAELLERGEIPEGLRERHQLVSIQVQLFERAELPDDLREGLQPLTAEVKPCNVPAFRLHAGNRLPQQFLQLQQRVALGGEQRRAV